jgi:hypothetical protein
MIRGFGAPLPAVEIPAAGGWSLTLLAVLMAGTAVLALRRRAGLSNVAGSRG